MILFFYSISYVKSFIYTLFLDFKEPSGTSRGILTRERNFFIHIFDEDHLDRVGIGECALFRGLSAEDKPDYEKSAGRCMLEF